MSTILKVKHLVKHYPGVKAVNGVDLEIEQGICFGLLGPNGAGKTTTIEMIEGITPPTAGEILYKGEPTGERFRNESGIQFQHTALQDFLTVREALDMFSSFYNSHADLDELIRFCALNEYLDRDNRKLSGGQRQRLLLAIALVNDPDIMFLDEPTTGLDPQARRNFWELVKRIKSRGKTVILTTHYMEEAYELCDQIAIMDHGRIIAQGTPQRLLREHFNDVVIQLPKEDFKVNGTPFSFEVMDKGEVMEIQTGDVNDVVKQLLAASVSLAGLKIRSRTLDDLFLELTGRDLRG